MAEGEDLRDIPSTPQFVIDPLGNPVAVPPGMTPRDVMDRMQQQLKTDHQLRGNVMRTLQLRDAQGSTDPTDPVFRRANLARQVDGPVEPGDIEDFLIRADLARSDLVTEKFAKLKAYYPDSEFHMAQDVDDSTVILYRHPGQSHYREVEAPEVSMGDLAALAGGTLSEDVVAEVLAFMAAGPQGGIIKNMMRAAGAGIVGEGVKQGIEKARGFQDTGLGPVTEQILTTGAIGGIGAGIFDPIARIINATRGVSGLTVPSPSAADAMRFAKDNDLPPLLPGQVHPVFESMQMQATGTSQVMEEFQRDAFHKVVTRLAEIRDDLGDFRSLSDDALNKFVEREEKAILSALSSVPEMTFATAGRKVHKGLNEFQTALAEREGRAYKAAFAASDGVRFDITPAQQVVAAIRGRAPLVDHKLPGLDLTVNVPLTPINTPAFRTAIDDLANLIPEVKKTQNNAMPLEQMVRLRSTFVNMADDERLTGTERASSAIIAKVLTEVMRNPRNLRGKKGNLKPSVTRKWRIAAERSLSRERWNSRVFGRLSAMSNTPSELAKKLNPNNPDLVKETRRALRAGRKEQAWGAVQASFRNNLLNAPARIRTKFKNWDKEALDMLVSKRDQKDLLMISDQWARFEKSPVQKMLRAGTDLGNRATNLVEKGTRAEIKELIAEAGGRGSPAGKALQAGVIESLLQRSTKFVKGRSVIDKEKVLSGLKSIRDRGVLDEIFDPATTRKFIDDLELYVSFLPRGMGAGEGIQKAEIASAVGGVAFPSPGNVTRALRGGAGLAKNRIIAWMFITPGARRFLVGTGAPRKAGVSVPQVSQIGAALAVTFDNMEDAAESGSFDTSAEDTIPDIF